MTIFSDTQNTRESSEWEIENVDLKNQISYLKSRLAFFEKLFFGHKSEKRPLSEPPEAMSLFGNPDQECTVELNTVETKPVAPNPGAPKTGHGRKAWPKNLKREVIMHIPPVADLLCQDCGQEKEIIGADSVELLQRIPAQYYVEKHVRPKYACLCCPEGGVCQIAAVPRLIPKGNICDSVVVQIAIDKYEFHSPLHRQSKIFRRNGIDITPSTMVGWIDVLVLLVNPIVAELHKRLIRGGIAYSDDTTIPVLEEDNPGGSHRGYMWFYGNGKDVAIMVYSPGRSQKEPLRVLGKFKGFLHSDAYAGYNGLHYGGDVTPVFCWAHARRKFIIAEEAGDVLAKHSLDIIGKLFKIEKYLTTKQKPASVKRRFRERVSSKLLSALWEHWKIIGLTVLPQSNLGKALAYVMPRKEGFTAFLHNGHLEMSNNLSERHLRQIVIGRKNYMFFGSEAGAHRGATIYSLIGTCKQIGLDPTRYFLHVISLLTANPAYPPKRLLPHIVARALA